MSKELRSSLVLFRYSTVSYADIAANGKNIVCEEASNVNSTSNVSERKTKCATFTTVDTPTVSISGSGVAVGDLGANEASAQDLIKLLDAGTNIFFEYKNDVSGTLAIGEVVYLAGQGYFSDVTITSDDGEGMVTFDWEFTVSGTVDYVP